MARINQHKGAAQGLPTGQILFQQALPFLDNGHRGIGITIARQIDEIVTFARGEKVDLLRPARRVRGPRQGLACLSAR